MTIGDSLGPEGRKPALRGVSGWLLFLCISLVLFNSLQVMLFLWLAIRSTAPSGDFAFAYLSLIIALPCLGTAAGILLYRERRLGLTLAKIFFAVRVLFTTAAVAGYVADSGISVQMLLVFGSSIAWLIYLFRSERVKATYARAGSANISEVFR